MINYISKHHIHELKGIPAYNPIKGFMEGTYNLLVVVGTMKIRKHKNYSHNKLILRKLQTY